MSAIQTLTQATLAASLTLVTFVGLPLAFSQSQVVIVEEVGVEAADERQVQVLSLSQDDLVELGLAEGPEVEVVADERSGLSKPLLTSSAGTWVIPNGTRPPPRARGTLSPKPSSSQRRCHAEPVDGIRSLGQTRYEVERSLVRSYTRDLDSLDRLASARRHGNGQGGADGYRLTRVGCQSPLRAAGLKRGDIVHSVNGLPVTTSGEVLKAYTKNRRAQTLRVKITRAGRPMTLRYDVV